MPQWDFLDFLAEHSKRYPSFRLKMLADVDGLLEDGAAIVGLTAKQPQGRLEVRSNLVIGADGRHSIVREKAGLKVEDLGAPMDVLWFRLAKRSDDEGQTLGRIQAGVVFVMLDRGDYWQCAYVIRKGGFDELKRAGLEAFQAGIAEVVPLFRDRVHELASWDDVKLLTVKIDRLSQWHRPGLLCIGDAAHAMSPVGGVGINLAIQDAVAAANILAGPLQHGAPSVAELHAVQRRRELPTRLTQAMQVFVQNQVLSPALKKHPSRGMSLVLALMRRYPKLRRIPARVVGIGIRPEHVRSPEIRGD
jgi:2-polyprenyl-6-methoxyphenol hydroxylase-like FAD-dependent oxidoreductase